jgi:hypothetical protein
MERTQGITEGAMKAGATRWSRIGAASATALCLLGGASERQAGGAAPPPAPACQEPDAGDAAAKMAAVIERLRRAEAEQAPGEVVVKTLDNRGYGYRVDYDALSAPPIREQRPQP